MLSLSAAAWAPLRIRSQNESPGTSWVIIATVARGVFACPPPDPSPPLLAGFPPVLEHALTPSISTAAAAAATSRPERNTVRLLLPARSSRRIVDRKPDIVSPCPRHPPRHTAGDDLSGKR